MHLATHAISFLIYAMLIQCFLIWFFAKLFDPASWAVNRYSRNEDYWDFVVRTAPRSLIMLTGWHGTIVAAVAVLLHLIVGNILVQAGFYDEYDIVLAFSE